MSQRAHRQTPGVDESEEEETETEAEPAENGTSPAGEETVPEGDGPVQAGEESPSFEGLVEEMIQSRIGELEGEIGRLEDQLEEVDNFTRISLNDRKIKQAEANLSEFSDSLTGFAEKAFNDINELENRLEIHSLYLAAILEGLDEEDVDLDLSDAAAYQEDQVVMAASPEERLRSAAERF